MEAGVIAAYIVGILAIYFVGKMFLVPIKWVWKLIYNGVVGGVMLWVVNLIGAYFDFMIGINVISALVAGLLGIPGVILLILFKILT